MIRSDVKRAEVLEKFVTLLEDCGPVEDWFFKLESSNPIMTP
jgi:hypothetical protein